MNTSNKTVLITGATSGIGLELAKLFAKDNYNMVLVARFEDTLKLVAEEFKSLGAGEITIILKDLSKPYSAEQVHDETKNKGIKVDVLVNDAGVGIYGQFSETNFNHELELINLNIVSTVHFTKLYLKDMLAAGEGKILQLASVASYQPTPLLSVYAATKAFILSFSDAIGTELRNTKVTVTSLIPNATNTDFFRKAGMEHTKAAQDTDSPAEVARVGYEALMNGQPHAYGPGVKSMAAISSVMSNRNVAEMTEKQMQPVNQ
ncbi:MAG TPA: SDR family oxidoreductase [Cytophagaceae bacterium]|nr:SDR family oxidoreductase [Cytophagaceae bacterium]